ncbi:MAG: aminotransferase class V-fold PLP-dependent enzyme [Gammaproteobacteria bacterium]|nr:aminotransferase class V-fold PLP-dependent enzyme [Gammaproteobacteria bacterium]MBT8104366.1 aminotransferase class V-fold PLP-dependent enzyme [Gammaproteobacteria bacterium]NNF49138.1 aminotransferase class V-fold PLP-dependent enzyme [Woeseiaceae bacterium]NNK24382.1 aminotransferase class V-fold PLP-dependent enzyme [Woeseiaceae bacterium]NNL63976.1 aminotransferase class V-fold PLP-dependent enzyme [Woeseiaceae bacterium]
MKRLDPAYLRQQIVGVDSTFQTPFGERLMVYCDYTASGRCLRFVESYLQGLQRIYANTHTEDDITGRSMSQLLHEAEEAIKASVNAGPQGRIIACGTGATGAIDKLQQIVGVTLPPATRRNLGTLLDDEAMSRTQPVVFIGPYEHHSNELSWRQSTATTVQVRLDAAGQIDLEHLEALLQDPQYRGRTLIGSFSAASNVTGMRSDVPRIASLLHRYGAIACFDYAACAPYVDIDMNPEPEHAGEDPSIDAIFVSPHKFLGGPGSSGVLVFNERIYDRSLPPSVSAGGTVDYVGMSDQDFISRIEEREKAGTPGVLQTLKAGLVFQIKDAVGTDVINEREHEHTCRALKSWAMEDNIEVLGNPDPCSRVGIISFNIRDPHGKYLHHKFLTALLNDLFGIQSRAGCSCAGPYGHRLLEIDEQTSEKYRTAVQQGYCGLKPGWCRVGLHWVMDDAEAGYIIDAVRFLAREGHRFLALYDFDLATGTWVHKRAGGELPRFSLDAALENDDSEPATLSLPLRMQLYRHYMNEAQKFAERLRREPQGRMASLGDELAELQFFALPDDKRQPH